MIEDRLRNFQMKSGELCDLVSVTRVEAAAST
jgi:hypothetical protein